MLLSKLPEDQELIFISNLPIMLFISYIYLVLIKRSNWGTLGYMITRVKIVSLEGKKPSIWKMTLRFLLLIVGPINFFFDIFWLTGDEHKQTLRDKIVGNYVIAEDAAPLGRNKILYTSYYLFGWSFVFREVKISSPK